MKKTIIIGIGILFLGTFLFFLFKKNVEVIIPFNHPLFLTENDLKSLQLDRYHFIENKDELAFWQDKSYVFASTTTIFPQKDSSSPSNSILIDIFGHIDASSAKQMYTTRKNVNSKFGPFVENYQNLGENNFLYTDYDQDEHLAYLNILNKNYLIVIQVISVDNLEEAKKQASLFGNLLLERIKKL